MATEQIQTNQIAGFTGSGARTAMQVFTLTGGTADISTNSFGFVIGPVMIELLVGTSDVNGTAVYSVLWNSMRSFSGSKTADITNRFARGPGNGGFIRMAVDRIGGGFGLRISPPFDGTDIAPDGTGAASFTPRDWPNPGVLRVTAWEDTSQ